MNGAYQLLSSTSEILFAVGFVLLARRIRSRSPKIRIRDAEASGLESVHSESQAAAEDEELKFLIVNGIDARGPEQVRASASQLGLICRSTILCQQGVLKNKGIRIKVSKSCSNLIHRQMLSCTPASGLLLAHLSDHNVEVVA